MARAPGVYTKEVDLSVRVPSSGGVIGAIVIPAARGPVNEPVFVSTETDLLRKFTPNEKVEVGYHTGYFSALTLLEKSGGLWVVRAANNPLFAGLVVRAAFSNGNNYALNQGLTDPSAFIFDEQPDSSGALEVFTVTTVADNNRSLAGKYFTFSSLATNYACWYRVTYVGKPEISQVSFVFTDVADLAGEYFTFAAGNSRYCVYYVVDGVGSQPSLQGYSFIEVALPASATQTDAAIATQAALQSVAAISVTRNTTTLTLTTVNNGDVEDTATSDVSVISVVIVQQGEADGIAGSAPSLPNTTLIPVTIAENATAQAVAAATRNALLAQANLGYTVTTQAPNVLLFTAESAGAVANAASGTSGFTVATVQEGADIIDADDEALFIYAADPGAWGNDIAIKITTSGIKEPNAFQIDVFKRGNLATPVESFICSRREGHLDGFGKNIFVEEVLRSSAYIRARSNPAVASDVLPKAIPAPMYLQGGNNGLAVTDSHWLAALQPLKSKETYKFNVILDAGHTSVAWQQALVQVAETRDDCIALLSTPYSAEADANYITALKEHVDTVLGINSSYAAIYTPHVKIYDKFNDRVIYTSPEAFAALAICEAANNFELWYPPAGFKRGSVKVLDVRRRFNQAEIGQLYDSNINCLRFAPGKGVVVWGQKTLLKRPSSLESVNVRMLLNVIKPAIAALLEDFVFELNDEGTRAFVTSLINGYMLDIQARRGVYEFKVVCDGTNNSAQDIANKRLNVHLYIKPTLAAEEITLSTIITPYGLSFEEAAAAV